MKKFTIRCMSLLMLICSLPFHIVAQDLFIPAEPAPKREIRAVWLTTLNGLDWPQAKANNGEGRQRQKQELCQILDRLKECGINTILLQTRIRGTVIYPSKMEPWDVALTGSYNKEPGYDPLAFAIEEAHRRGMELHAWVVSVPVFKTSIARKTGKKSLIYTHPSLLCSHQGSYYMNPGEPGTATYLARLCAEIARNYDVDGIHLDYIRYPEGAETFADGATYRKYGKKQNKAEWRRDNVTRLVQQIHDSVKTQKPWVRLSCSPVGKFKDVSRFNSQGWNAYHTVYQDAQGWLKDGYMDMLLPMMYFQGNHFYPFAADWQENACGKDVAPGLGIYFMHPKEKNWDIGVIQRELCYIRQQGLNGQAYFRSKFLTDNTKGIYDYLKTTYYPYPALMPAMDWNYGQKPQAPKLKKVERCSGTTEHLEWEEVTNGGSSCRYALYASSTSPVDTENPKNLVTVTWNTSYEYNLLSLRLYNLHLVLTAVDRYGNESEPVAIIPDR